MTIREQLEEILKKAFVGKRLVWERISASEDNAKKGDSVMDVTDIHLMDTHVAIYGSEPMVEGEKKRWFLTYFDIITLADEGSVQFLEWECDEEKWRASAIILKEKQQ